MRIAKKKGSTKRALWLTARIDIANALGLDRLGVRNTTGAATVALLLSLAS